MNAGKDSSRRWSDFFKGNLCIFIATVFFGVNIPVVKLLIPHWMSAMDVTVFRLIGGCALMWIASVLIKTTPLRKPDFVRVALGGVLGIFLFIFLFNMSLHYGDPIDISIIMTLPPVFVILIGALFMHRHALWMEWAGVGVAFVGAFIIIMSHATGQTGAHRLLGDLLALASTLCYAFYLVVIEKPAANYRPLSYLKWIFLFASVPALALLPAFPDAAIFHRPDNGEAWALICFVVLCPTFLSYFLLSPATRLIGSELVSIYQYLVPVVATVATVAMGLAALHWVQVAAMIIIVAGMVLTNIGKKHNNAS